MMVIVFTGKMAKSQTIVDNIPIESEWPYIVKVWAHNPEIDKWGWYEIIKTGNAGALEWYIEREMSCVVDQYDVLDVMFIRGFENCGDTTRVKIYGSYEKHLEKDKPDLRNILKLDGELHEFGIKIERPNQ
jgi:hypothetical protein